MPGPLPLVPAQVPPPLAREPGPPWRLHRAERTAPVTISVPLVALLGAVVFAAWRYMGLKVWQAVLCLLFGFFLAATTAAPG